MAGSTRMGDRRASPSRRLLAPPLCPVVPTVPCHPSLPPTLEPAVGHSHRGVSVSPLSPRETGQPPQGDSQVIQTRRRGHGVMGTSGGACGQEGRTPRPWTCVLLQLPERLRSASSPVSLARRRSEPRSAVQTCSGAGRMALQGRARPLGRDATGLGRGCPQTLTSLAQISRDRGAPPAEEELGM